jgi:hypothetical protein
MANPAIEHLNSPPTPKQKHLFEQLVGKKFPAWAIVTRQGCNIAIKEILRQQNLGLVYDSILVPAMAFVVRWRTEVIVEAMAASVSLTQSMALSVLCRDSESVHHDGPLSHRKMLEVVKTVDPENVSVAVDPFMVVLEIHRAREIC